MVRKKSEVRLRRSSLCRSKMGFWLLCFFSGFRRFGQLGRIA